MNAKELSTLFLVVMAIATAVGPALAGEPPSTAGAPSFGPPPIARLFAENIGRLLVLRADLNVTGEQRQKIAAAVKGHREEMRPAAQAVLEKKRVLREAILKNPSDQEAIRKASLELGKAIGDAAVVVSKVVSQGRQALTPEQIEKIRTFVGNVDRAENNWLEQIGK